MTSFEIFKIILLNIFSYMALGFLAAWLGIFSQPRIQFVMRKVVINFLFPCLVADKILKNLEITDFTNAIILFIGALVMFIGNWLIVRLWIPRVAQDRITENTMLHCNTFHNYGFMVFPLVIAFLGDKALALTLIYTLTGDGLLWSFGIYLLQRDPNSKVKWKEIITPPAIAVVVSVFLAFTGLSQFIPREIFFLSYYPALIAVPVALVGAGGIFYHAFSGIKLERLPIKELAYSLLSRMILLPLFWSVVIYFCIPVYPARQILFFEAIMPASVVMVALVAIYHGNKQYAVVFSLATILFSIVTIPFYLGLIMSLGGGKL
ncbi:MAG: AEC family transporter [Fibrobacteria bacterium]|nr:AEC family transporter [Fibrobacteria bacterium]